MENMIHVARKNDIVVFNGVVIDLAELRKMIQNDEDNDSIYNIYKIFSEMEDDSIQHTYVYNSKFDKEMWRY